MINREIKFRFWNKEKSCFVDFSEKNWIFNFCDGIKTDDIDTKALTIDQSNFIVQQFTGTFF